MIGSNFRINNGVLFFLKGVCAYKPWLCLYHACACDDAHSLHNFVGEFENQFNSTILLVPQKWEKKEREK